MLSMCRVGCVAQAAPAEPRATVAPSAAVMVACGLEERVKEGGVKGAKADGLGVGSPSVHQLVVVVPG